MKTLPLLLDAICEVYDNVQYIARNGTTYCNQAVNNVAERMGFLGFIGLNANHMVDLMDKHPEIWKVVDAMVAATKAEQGCLVIAGLKDEPRGHVAVIRPGNLVVSAKWQTQVPKCINIGISHTISLGVNYAFEKEPKYYMYII